MSDTWYERGRQLGIQFTYLDAGGHECEIDEEMIPALVAALSVADAPRDTPIVLNYGDVIEVGQFGSDPGMAWRLISENGPEIARGDEIQQIALPADLPPGGYRLEVASSDGRSAARDLVIAPRQAFQPPFALNGERCWLLAVQLYGIQSPSNWSHGDFGDLAKLLTLVAQAGGDGVGLNPLHALFEDLADEASPYAPNSRQFLNPLYLEMANIPGLTDDIRTANKPAVAAPDDLIDYVSVANAKFTALRSAHRRFRAAPAAELLEAFESYRRHAGLPLARYGTFMVLRGRYGPRWCGWPEPWCSAAADALDRLAEEEADEVEFQSFLQWQAHVQLDGCRELAARLGLRIGLYLDLAVGVHPDGFDAWSRQDVFLRDIVIGAPPDPLNQSGQNWGLTAFNPTALMRQAYRPFRETLAATMQYAGAMRYDHVLGLNRLYLIPEGKTGRSGAYVTYPLMDLLGVLGLESQRHECLVIGEDLGTVPAGLREILRHTGIWTFLVMQFARDANGDFLPPEAYAAQGLATFGTHDLPTLAGWQQARDLSLLRSLDIPAGESGADRKASRQALARVLDRAGIPPASIETRILHFLGRTPSGVLSVSLEDILGIAEQVNLPGTHREYPNWRRRLPARFDMLEGKLAEIGAILRSEGRGRHPIN